MGLRGGITDILIKHCVSPSWGSQELSEMWIVESLTNYHIVTNMSRCRGELLVEMNSFAIPMFFFFLFKAKKFHLKIIEQHERVTIYLHRAVFSCF